MEIWKKMWVGVFFLNTVYIRTDTWLLENIQPLIIILYIVEASTGMQFKVCYSDANRYIISICLNAAIIMEYNSFTRLTQSGNENVRG